MKLKKKLDDAATSPVKRDPCNGRVSVKQDCRSITRAVLVVAYPKSAAKYAPADDTETVGEIGRFRREAVSSFYEIHSDDSDAEKNQLLRDTQFDDLHAWREARLAKFL